MTINDRVKLLRKQLGLSQTEFGDKVGIAQGHMTNIETGRREVTEKSIKVICLQFNVNEGDLVSKDEILARQDMGNLPDSSIEQSLIKSPIDGIVVKKEVNAGEALSPGKTAALLADPENFYVTAKIDETKTCSNNYR